jgi:hypothetical protein
MKSKISNLKILLILPLIIFLSGCKKDDPEAPVDPPVVNFYKGADISFLPEIEENGTKFYDQDGKIELLPDILKKTGLILSGSGFGILRQMGIRDFRKLLLLQKK